MWRSNPTLKQDCLQLVDEPGVRVHKSSPNTVDGLHRELVIVLGGTKRIVERCRPRRRPKRFNKPTDVEVVPDGSVYVTDGYGNNRIVKFDSVGNFIAAWGSKGTGLREFDTPHGLAIDDGGRVYVADRGISRVQVFDADGTFVSEWKSNEIRRPWSLDITAEGNVVVAGGGDLTGTAYDRNGVLLMTTDGEILER